MKRFHVHVAVEDLAASVAFYAPLLGQAPTVLRPDYAQWLLDDPRVNFALSARGHSAGVNHLGIQADTPQELAELQQQAERAAQTMAVGTEGGVGRVHTQRDARCCYARSDKHWVLDPGGLAWEQFLTHARADAYGEDGAPAGGGPPEDGAAACCIPLHRTAEASASPCCVPAAQAAEGVPSDKASGEAPSACCSAGA